MLRGIRKDAKRSQDGKTPAFGLATAIAFVNEESVRGKFFRKCERRQLSGAEILVYLNEFPSRGLDLKPVRRAAYPVLHDGRSLLLAEFGNDSRRNEYSPV